VRAVEQHDLSRKPESSFDSLAEANVRNRTLSEAVLPTHACIDNLGAQAPQRIDMIAENWESLPDLLNVRKKVWVLRRGD
jgi:hypothetical protein